VGRVMRTREAAGAGLVDVRVACVNQAGEETAVAEATVQLPRGEDISTYPAALFSEEVASVSALYG